MHTITHEIHSRTHTPVDEELVSGEDECVYLCSNSLGLQTTRTKEYVMNDLTRWAEMLVHSCIFEMLNSCIFDILKYL